MTATAQSSKIVRHIEVKAYLDSYKKVCNRVAALADKPPVDQLQHDIFFQCRSGRLKLRSSGQGSSGQIHNLIYYRRRDDYGPTESIYQSAHTTNPVALRSSLNSAFGEAGRVKKFRRTYRIGNTTVHLDRVGGLGEFLEIKAELGGQSTRVATRRPENLGFENRESENRESENRESEGRESENLRTNKSSSLSPKEAIGIVESLMTTLDVDLFQLIDGAYIDLINERNGLSIF